MRKTEVKRGKLCQDSRAKEKQSWDLNTSIQAHLVIAMVFPLVMYGCENWTIKKAECRRIDAFELWCCVCLFVTSWTATCQAFLSITNSWSLLKLMSIKSVMPSNHLILCHPLLPPSIFPSIRIFSNESVLHIRWPKFWSFSFSPSDDYSGLISFRIDWFDLLHVQGTLQNLEHHSLRWILYH